MKLIAEIEGSKDALQTALEEAGLRLITLQEVVPVSFGAMRPCPDRGKIARHDIRWGGNPTDEQCRYCVACGVEIKYLGRGENITWCHPDEGEVPDYGQPELIPVGAKLVRYDRMEVDCGRLFLGAFYPDGRLVRAKEIRGEYHKNGKWSYADLSVVVPEDCVLLCESLSTHSNANSRRYLKFREKVAEIGKLFELDRIPDAGRISQQLGVEISPVVLERIVLYRALFAARQRWIELKSIGEIPTF